jgi:hypothetical protein
LQENTKDSQITIEEEEKARMVQDTVHSENSRSIEPKVYPFDAGESTTPLQTSNPRNPEMAGGLQESPCAVKLDEALPEPETRNSISVNESTMSSTPLQTNELEAVGDFKPEAVEYLQESLVVKH